MKLQIWVQGGEAQKKQIEPFAQEFQYDVVVSADQIRGPLVLLLRPGIRVLHGKFFKQVEELASLNKYLDVLKHKSWILFNTEFVKLNDGRDYWSLNLRPAHFIDDTTWTYDSHSI